MNRNGMGPQEERPAELNARTSADQDAIRAQVEAVAGSSTFAAAARGAQLLRYICEQALAGKGDQVNEYAIGVDVFQRPASFDPRVDSIVRTEISRLRKRLKEHYAGEGAASGVRIELPLRSYVPVFTSGVPAVPAPPPSPAPDTVRGRRPASMWMVAALAAVWSVLLAGALVWWGRARGIVRPAGPSVAVLPFLNLSGDPAKEYLADSVTDELTETLAESRDLRVVARTSAFQFKNKGDDVRDIGRKLNVGAVLEGSVQPGPDHFRVIAQLIRTSDGYHLWSHTYDDPAAELQTVETEITLASARTLLPAGRPPAAAGHSLTTTNPQAHDLYLRSIYELQQRTPESLQESLKLAQKAVELDPGYVRAYGAIIRAERSLEPLRLVTPAEAREKSAAALQKALQLDPAYSDGHAWLAYDAYVKDWDWPRAEKEFQLALAADGPHGQADNLYGWSLITRRRFREARTRLQIAEDLDPMSPGSRANMVIDLIFERNFAEARREVARIFDLNPKSLTAISDLGWIEILQGNCAAARAAARQAADWYPQLDLLVRVPVTESACGKPEAARALIAEAEKQSASAFISPYVLAESYACLKDAGHALEYLEKSAGQRESTVMYLEIDTLLDPVRTDPRFRALERRIGLVD